MVEITRQGYYHNDPEFIDKEFPVTIIKKGSQIEYLIIYDYCKVNGWVRRKDAIYCCGNCRKLAYRERKKNQPK